jgi:hypothetical protein
MTHQTNSSHLVHTNISNRLLGPISNLRFPDEEKMVDASVPSDSAGVSIHIDRAAAGFGLIHELVFLGTWQ